MGLIQLCLADDLQIGLQQFS